ncbi:MAG: molybdopterin-binding/glycosyltransferase family 2 protein [Pseudomonadota bacterium]
MKFGSVPVAEAEGAILAHSIGFPGGRLKKGRVLCREDLEQLAAAGLSEITVAEIEPGDVSEDRAAARIAAALAPEPETLGLTMSEPFTGRVNFYAEKSGVMIVDPATVSRLNRIDEAVTLATVDNYARVAARQMIATVKIIPYSAPESAVAEAVSVIAAKGPPLRVHSVALRTAGLILTRTPGMADKVVAKGAEAVRARLRALGIALSGEAVVPHDTMSLAAALTGMSGEVVLILTGSATSDRQDVGPKALREAGGALTRFGMPVDPGNLLFLGQIGHRPVIGLPGCARSPKLNGADWVLERVACGLEVTAAEIGAMGVGGLLKEIPSRPAPRAGEAEPATGRRPWVSAVLLAAGQSSRMGDRDKLLEPVAGQAVLRRLAETLASSGAEEVIAVLRPEDLARRRVLADAAVRVTENPRAAEGMGTSIAAGVVAANPAAEAVLIALADMPEVTAQHINRMIAAFDPAEGRAIVRAVAEDGTPGHPVLFSKRFFEGLRGLGGDNGAREILRENADFIVDVPLPGRVAVTDLDTPQDWAAWRAGSTAGPG